MKPDPAEFKALDDAMDAFDAAYVNVVQAIRRIQRICEIEKVLDARVPTTPKELPIKTETSGNFCPRCYSVRLRIKGGGCVACLDCSFDLGCGGG